MCRHGALIYTCIQQDCFCQLQFPCICVGWRHPRSVCAQRCAHAGEISRNAQMNTVWIAALVKSHDSDTV